MKKIIVGTAKFLMMLLNIKFYKINTAIIVIAGVKIIFTQEMALWDVNSEMFLIYFDAHSSRKRVKLRALNISTCVCQFTNYISTPDL